MEWKQLTDDMHDEFEAPLETSLVEWKHNLLPNIGIRAQALETSLVEWKRPQTEPDGNGPGPWKLP